MTNIILAFIIGVLCGICFMWLKYGKQLQKNIRQLHDLELSLEKLKGKSEALDIINGIAKSK